MNYSININQLAAVTYFPELDIIDLAIFDYINNFIGKSEKTVDQFGIWFWVSHKKVMDDMPLLRIKTRQGFIKRINNLIDCEIIERHPNCKELSRTYYKPGINWDVLIKQSSCNRNITPPVNNELHPPVNDGLHDHYTNIDHSTNDHKKENETFSETVNQIYNSVINYFPKETQPSSLSERNKWLSDIEKLIRLDKKEPHEIIFVVKWARNNEFWKGNFLSILKLRKKNKDGVTYYNYFLNQIKNGKLTNTQQKQLSIYDNKDYTAGWDT